MISTVRVINRNVKHWTSREMCLRWTAAGMLEAENRSDSPGLPRTARVGVRRTRPAGPTRPGWATVSRVELQQRIADRTGEFLVFAVTPPKLATQPEESR